MSEQSSENVSQKELVNHPSHYQPGPYEHFLVSENWEMSPYMYVATAYLMRAPHKGQELRDLQKTRWYLCKMIESPWTILTTFDLKTKLEDHLTIKEVAEAWFGVEPSPRKQIFYHMANAILRLSAIQDLVEELLLARNVLDKEIVALEKIVTESAC